MKKLLLLFGILMMAVLAYGQPDTVFLGTVPNDGTGDNLRTAIGILNVNDQAAFDSLTAHIIGINDLIDTSLVHRTELDGHLDSLAVHLDTLQSHRVDLNAYVDSLAVHLDTIQVLRIDINDNIDTLAVHRTDINRVLDSLGIHLDSLQQLRVDINVNAGNIATNTSNIAINTTSFQDSIGWFNVKSPHGGVPGATGDGVADDTEAVQAAIDAAKYGTVYFPPGKYSVDTLQLLYATKLLGPSRTDYLNEGGASIMSDSSGAIIHYMNIPTEAFGYGAIIENLHIIGSDDAANTLQAGILIDTEGEVIVEKCRITECGGYGIELGRNSHATVITIRDNIITDNNLGGIYGATTSDRQVNAIFVLNNSISQNSGYGLNLIGNNLIIRDNTIQGNDSTGIFFSHHNLQASSGANLILVEGNYTENNGGGSIYAEMGFDSPYVHSISNLKIIHNKFQDDAAVIDKPEATACITLNHEPGFESQFYFYDLVIRDNSYISTDCYHVNGNDVVDQRATIGIPDIVITPSDEFALLRQAKTIRFGVVNGGQNEVAAFDAATGIVEAELAPYMWINNAAAIDITADPQIDAGYEGQVIVIIVDSDANALTLDDGTGLNISAQWVGGLHDSITLIFDYWTSTWIELSRVNN